MFWRPAYRAGMADRVPLVLLHGFPMDRRIWTAQADALADLAEVVPLDFRGFGTSADDRPFSIDDLADDVHRWVDGQPCVLGGLSMGGYVALSVADRYPGDLAGLVLFDTKATADDAAARAKRDEMIALAAAGGAGAITAEMEPKLLSAAASDAIRARFRRMANGVPPATLARALAAMRDRPDRTDVLGRIGVPTLCVVGADDAVTPPAVVEALRRQIPGAELAVIDGAGHVPPVENPAAVNAVLRPFLTRLAAGG